MMTDDDLNSQQSSMGGGDGDDLLNSPSSRRKRAAAASRAVRQILSSGGEEEDEGEITHAAGNNDVNDESGEEEGQEVLRRPGASPRKQRRRSAARGDDGGPSSSYVFAENDLGGRRGAFIVEEEEEEEEEMSSLVTPSNNCNSATENGPPVEVAEKKVGIDEHSEQPQVPSEFPSREFLEGLRASMGGNRSVLREPLKMRVLHKDYREFPKKPGKPQKSLTKLILENGRNRRDPDYVAVELQEWRDLDKKDKGKGAVALSQLQKNVKEGKVHLFKNVQVCAFDPNYVHYNRGSIRDPARAYYLDFNEARGSSFEELLSVDNSDNGSTQRSSCDGEDGGESEERSSTIDENEYESSFIDDEEEEGEGEGEGESDDDGRTITLGSSSSSRESTPSVRDLSPPSPRPYRPEEHSSGEEPVVDCRASDDERSPSPPGPPRSPSTERDPVAEAEFNARAAQLSQSMHDECSIDAIKQKYKQKKSPKKKQQKGNNIDSDEEEEMPCTSEEARERRFVEGGDHGRLVAAGQAEYLEKCLSERERREKERLLAKGYVTDPVKHRPDASHFFLK